MRSVGAVLVGAFLYVGAVTVLSGILGLSEELGAVGRFQGLRPPAGAWGLATGSAAALFVGAVLARLAVNRPAVHALAVGALVLGLMETGVWFVRKAVRTTDPAYAPSSEWLTGWGAVHLALLVVVASLAARIGAPRTPDPAAPHAARSGLAVLTGWFTCVGGSRVLDLLTMPLFVLWVGTPGIGFTLTDAVMGDSLRWQLATGLLAAFLGGWATGVVARRRPLAHALGLSALLVMWSLLSLTSMLAFHEYGGSWPTWLFAAGAGVWPAGALFGAWLAARTTARADEPIAR